MTDPKKLPEDRTDLATLWADAVAEVDELTEALTRARKKEREVWDALERSRRASIPSED